MATQAQVHALVDSHVKHDLERFKAVTLQIAADAANKKQHQYSELLRRATVSVKIMQPLPMGGASTLTRQVVPRQEFSEIFVIPELRAEVNGFIHEYKNRAKLRERGLDVRRRLVFTGPPGTGKTVTAGAIALALDIPFFIVRIDEVIDSFLGKTATNLRNAFDVLKGNEGIYLFDEFDALASQRNQQGTPDHREMSRVVNSLLQFLEEDGLGVVIAATNLTGVLDSAVWRRFELKLNFGLPQHDHVVAITERIFTLAKIEVSGDWDWMSYPSRLLDERSQPLCHADVETVAKTLARKVVLEDLPAVTREMVGPVVSSVRRVGG